MGHRVLIVSCSQCHKKEGQVWGQWSSLELCDFISEHKSYFIPIIYTEKLPSLQRIFLDVVLTVLPPVLKFCSLIYFGLFLPYLENVVEFINLTTQNIEYNEEKLNHPESHWPLITHLYSQGVFLNHLSLQNIPWHKS